MWIVNVYIVDAAYMYLYNGGKSTGASNKKTGRKIYKLKKDRKQNYIITGRLGQ